MIVTFPSHLGFWKTFELVIPLEIKIIVASFDEKIWIQFALWDEEFKKYAYSLNGVIDCISVFTTCNTEINVTGYNIFGKLHRINDLPAIEYANGTKAWYKNGKCHREMDKPAFEYADGTKRWYIHGTLHREGLPLKPAVESANGDKFWYINGEHHRDNDKPAIEYADGTKHWFINGECHRENDLPAVEFPDGTKE